MKIVVMGLLMIYGLITAMQSMGSFNPAGGTPNPKWINWWHTPLGQSWLFARLGIEKSYFGALIGILWIAAGACLIAAALGLSGLIIPISWWRILAGAGAVISLILFFLYAHPLYAIGIDANLAILLVLLLAKWPSVQSLGS